MAALSQQIEENHRTLGLMAGDLMGLGDQAAQPARRDHRDLNAGSKTLAEHGEALDRAAEAAGPISACCSPTLPQAEESARRMAETLRQCGRSAIEQAAASKRRSASSPRRPSRPTRSFTKHRSGCLANLSNIEAPVPRPPSGCPKRGPDDHRHRRSARPVGRSAGRNPHRDRRPGRRRLGAGRAEPASIGRAGIDASELLGERLTHAGARSTG